MTMEELVKAAEKVAEAWLAFGKQLKEAVDAVSEVFNAAFGSPELWPKKDGTTPKKYGMSLRKCVAGHAKRYFSLSRKTGVKPLRP